MNDSKDSEIRPLVEDGTRVDAAAHTPFPETGMDNAHTTPAPIYRCNNVSMSFRIANASLPVG
jgi:hypothetical protein